MHRYRREAVCETVCAVDPGRKGETTTQPQPGAGRKLPTLDSRAAGSVRASRADPTEAGLMSPVSLDDSPLSKGGTEGMTAPRESDSGSGPGSPTYRALAPHAASIETFLSAGGASTSALDESTALAQLMQVLNENPAPDDL